MSSARALLARPPLVLVLCMALAACEDRAEDLALPGAGRAYAAPRLAPDALALELDPELAAELEAAEQLLPGTECLLNEHGFRRKVLATEAGIRCLDRVPGGVPQGSPLGHFRPYFVFDLWPADGEPEYYRIGSTPRRSSVLGWAPAARMAPWDSRVGVRYARAADERVPPLLVYADPDPLVELLERGSTEAQPIARARLDAPRALMPWPVAETRHHTASDGRVFELVRLSFLAEVVEDSDFEEQSFYDEAPAPTYAEEERQRILRDVQTLDIVFCVDNTHSTAPYLDSIREAVRTIALELARQDQHADLQLGLVLYRDYIDGLMYSEGGRESVTKMFPLEGDLLDFLARIEHLREPSISSDDYAEAGFDGLHAAVTQTAWRGGALSARVVVLIGDNSFHEPSSSKNPRDIGVELVRSEAQARGVRIHTLNIHGKGGDEEQELHRRQFEQIAAAGGGSCFDIRDAGRVAERIRAISGEQLEVVGTRALVTSEFARGESAERIAAEHQLDIHQVTEVMEFLEGAGVDLMKLGPGRPTFATGWALVELRGTPVLGREVYVARSEVDILLSALNQLRSVLSGSTSIGQKVGILSLAGHIDPLSDFFSGKAAEDLDVFLMAKGIPVGRNSVLRLSATDVQHMSEASRGALRERVARWCIPNLTNALNDDSLWVHRDVHEFGWIAEEMLP